MCYLIEAYTLLIDCVRSKCFKNLFLVYGLKKKWPEFNMYSLTVPLRPNYN